MMNNIAAIGFNQSLYPQNKSANLRGIEKSDESRQNQHNALSSADSQKVLSDKVIDSLDKVLKKSDAAPIRSLDNHEYTPKAVSERILGFIQDAINRVEARGGDRSSLLEQARQGVKQGFQDAENILSSLNALSGKIADGIQNTFNLVQAGLDGMGSTAVRESVSLESTKQTQTQSLNLEIKTKDGDLLTLNLQKSQSSENYQAQIINAKTNTNISEFNFNSTSKMEFSVQGSLDKAEIEAIKELLADVKGVADQFFKGNTSAAMKAGFGLGYDSKELTSFSLNLNQSQTQSVTQAYQEVSSYREFADNSRPPIALNNLLSPIQDFAKSLESALFNAENSGKFESNSVENLFNFFSQSDDAHQAMVKQLESLSGKSFEKITSDIISRL